MSADAVCDELVESGATALLLLVGTPEPTVPIVEAVRADARLANVLIGAPAGQPEWAGLAGVPFLRYLPAELSPPGRWVEAELGEAPSFVAFEGYDAITVLNELFRIDGDWSGVSVEGSRGEITFARSQGIWQWMWPAIQVAELDPANPAQARILHTG